MKTRLILSAGLFSLIILFAFRNNNSKNKSSPTFNLAEYKKKTSEAAKVMARYKLAFSMADIKITESVY